MSKRRIGSRLSGAGFTRGMLADLEREELVSSFGGQGLITEVLEVIGDGKEATVYACAAHPDTGVERLAAKVYRSDRFKAFRGSRSYAGRRGHRDARSARAIQNATAKGRLMAHHEWVAWEWEVMCTLYDAGADVPRPLAQSADAILMEHIGSGDEAAPKLRHVELDPETARAAFARLMQNVEILLDCHLIHGDLSAYNLLWWQDRAWVIDLPQAVDARTHHDAETYLRRDVANLERHFRRFGLSAGDASRRLWTRYRRGELGR
ncbi:MAG: hypothetical protein MJE66_18555 [Proteobacteria bacterium]|nr:hypothetical protein [Pseudomonadota bacterium]